ncbi:ubiquitin-like-specific protease 1 isoform X2 [Polypterus senegalus]|nr:ubiquitin-like-specific protease 1 isoform X2 [Polypterus senegalus]
MKNKDIPKQPNGSVDCGIYMLMNALYLTMEEPFDFTADDMPAIRKWWCLVVLEISSYGWLLLTLYRKLKGFLCQRQKICSWMDQYT